MHRILQRCTRKVGWHLSCGPFWHILWTMTSSASSPDRTFLFAFVIQKLKSLICSLFYSFGDITVWVSEGREANVCAQLPFWTWNSIILIFVKCRLCSEAFNIILANTFFCLLWILRIFCCKFWPLGHVLDRFAALTDRSPNRIAFRRWEFISLHGNIQVKISRMALFHVVIQRFRIPSSCYSAFPRTLLSTKRKNIWK